MKTKILRIFYCVFVIFVESIVFIDALTKGYYGDFFKVTAILFLFSIVFFAFQFFIGRGEIVKFEKNEETILLVNSLGQKFACRIDEITFLDEYPHMWTYAVCIKGKERTFRFPKAYFKKIPFDP